MGAGIACGALWEVAEWAFDQFAPGNVIKGKYDSILDIIMDTGGALVAGGLAILLMTSPRWSATAAIGTTRRSSPYGGLP